MKKLKHQLKKPSNHLSFRRVLVLGIIAAIGIYIITNLFSFPQIANIGSPETAACQTNVSSISFHDECKTANTFNRAVYTCQDSPTSEKIASNFDCTPYTKLFSLAQEKCGQKCVPTSPPPPCIPNPCPPGAACKLPPLPDGQRYCPIASSKPSPSPLVSPIPVPSANTGWWDAKCRVRAYKLMPNDDVTKAPMTYATSDREVDISRNPVKAGESYAYLLEVTVNNIPSSIATISAATNNLHGFDEPIIIKSTSPNCQAEAKSKYMSCSGRPGINLPKILNDEPTLLDFGMVVTIQPAIESLYNTSFSVNPYFTTSTGTGTSASCALMMLHDSSLAVSTPTPTPTPPPGCVYQEKWCVQSLLGNTCPPVVICNALHSTPTPTPTSSVMTVQSPLLSPIATSTPIPTPSLPPAPDGCYYKNRLCLNRVIGKTCPPTLICPKPTISTKLERKAKNNILSCYRDCRQNKNNFIQCIGECFR